MDTSKWTQKRERLEIDAKDLRLFINHACMNLKANQANLLRRLQSHLDDELNNMIEHMDEND